MAVSENIDRPRPKPGIFVRTLFVADDFNERRKNRIRTGTTFLERKVLPHILQFGERIDSWERARTLHKQGRLYNWARDNDLKKSTRRRQPRK